MLKVMVVVGTRPELIRLSCVLKVLKSFSNLIFVHTGQNYDYELNQVFFEEMKLPRPDYYLDAADESPTCTISNILKKIDKLIEVEAPDAFLVLGDTNSALSAIAAKRKKVPIFHMEAGNRCFDMRVPEEINRRIVDHISDINLPYSTIARDYLIAEGIKPQYIIKTGSPMYEVLFTNREEIKSSKILEKLNLSARAYIVVSIHREENTNSSSQLHRFSDLLNKILCKYSLPVVVSTHPRTRNQLNKYNIKFDERVLFNKPFGFFDYIKLQSEAFITLSDSGTITEESSILGFKALNLRDAHERPEGFEVGAVPMVGFHADRIIEMIDYMTSAEYCIPKTVNDYMNTNVSDIVYKTICSYVNYVKSNVWMEDPYDNPIDSK